MREKEIRLSVDESTHAAVKILAENAAMTLDRWVAMLVRNEVSRQLGLARQLTATISEKDLLRIEVVSPRKPQRIYFIQRGDGGLIKIGVAANVAKRLAGLQVACAEELRLLAEIEQTSELTERKLHRRFRHLQRGGEWFACDAELLKFIRSIQEATPFELAASGINGEGKAK